jgi:GPH family glycoside/pentoside/hexuronide:cation symporter
MPSAETSVAPLVTETNALPRSEHIGFGVGSLASATFGVVPGLVLLYYLTNVLGVGAALAGAVLFVPKLLDLVVNPIVGRLSDSTDSALGPRRPWMLVGAVVLPLGFLAIFTTPFEGNAAAWWVALTLAITGVGFSCFVIPYSVLPAELGANSSERTVMVAWRMAFLGVAILAAGGLAPIVAGSDGGGKTGYLTMATITSVIMFVGILGALYGARKSTRATSTLAPRNAGSLRAGLRAAKTNQPFRVILGVFMLIEVVMSVSLAGLPFIADYILGDSGAIALLFICIVGPMVLTMPLWRRASVMFGKRASLCVATAIYGVGLVAVVLLPLVDASIRLEFACVALAVGGIGYAGAMLFPQAMLADVLTADVTDSGQRRAGLLSGLWAAGETMAGAIGAGAYGLILAACGFISTTEDDVVAQPDSAEWGIVLGYAGISVVGIVAALVLLSRYRLTERAVDEALENAAV